MVVLFLQLRATTFRSGEFWRFRAFMSALPPCPIMVSYVEDTVMP